MKVDVSKELREYHLDELVHAPVPYGPRQLVRNFSHGWEGPLAIVAALCAVERGDAKIARFFVAEHPNNGVAVACYVAVSKGEDGSWRYCGEGDHPDRASSHKLADDLLVAIANLTWHLAREAARLPTRGDIFRIAEDA